VEEDGFEPSAGGSGSFLTRRWREMDSNHRFLSQEKPVYVAEGELRGDRTGHQRNLRGTDSSKPSPSTSEVSCEPDCGVLRTAAGELLSTDDIAGRVIEAKGFDRDSILRAAIREQIGSTVKRLHRNGAIENIGARRASKWKLKS